MVNLSKANVTQKQEHQRIKELKERVINIPKKMTLNEAIFDILIYYKGHKTPLYGTN